MTKNLHYFAYVLLLPAAIAVADNGIYENPEPKLISGMSIIGNDESPKSLYIVPWKSTGKSGGVKISSDIMKEDLVPVDKSAFIREIDYYNSNNPTSSAVSN
ncbi:MAG: hypothetical protein R8M11_09395 [Gallionella sp.]